jgi:hypothetical protein
VVVAGFINEASVPITGVSWNGASFADVLSKSVTAQTVNIWVAHNVPAGTAVTMTVTWGGSGGGAKRTAFATELIPTVGPLTTGTSTDGTGSTNPATTGSLTGTPNSGADVAWIAALGVKRTNADAAPTWTNPDSAGQKNGSSGGGSQYYLAEGYEINSGAVTQAMSASMATAALYVAVMAVFLEPAAGAAFLARPNTAQPYTVHRAANW